MKWASLLNGDTRSGLPLPGSNKPLVFKDIKVVETINLLADFVVCLAVVHLEVHLEEIDDRHLHGLAPSNLPAAG